ncbi:hypothetical protein ACKAV7_008380 [Fusarium commune]
MSAKHAERTISYASPEDWDSWSNEFKKLAHAYDLWQYIDPTDRIRWPQRPELPEIRDYPRQADPDDPDSGTMTPGSDYVPPRRIGELTSEGRAEYEHDIRIYSLKETAYRETKKQEQKLVEFVLKTVSATYQKTSCVTGDRLDKWYQELRRSGVVYNERLRPEARDKYHKAVHTAPKINKLNEWVTEWETTMAEAISKKVPDALDAQCWAEDLNRAMYHVLPSWASTFRQHRRPQILNNSLNYREVAADIRYEAKMANASGRPSGIKRGAFAATYGAASRNDRPAITDRDNDTIEVQGDASDWATDETSYAHRDTRGQGRGRRARGGGRGVSTKRKRAETTVNPNPDGPTCRGCLGFHNWKGCWYLFPAQKAEGWEPNQAIQRLINDRLKNDTSLVEEVKRLSKTFNCAPYPLRHSAILDSGSTIHIFNEVCRFLNYRPAPSGDFVYAGESPVAIHGKDDSILCTLTDHFDQYVLEHIDKSTTAAAFLAKRKQYDSWTKRPPRSGDETFWHLRLGHPGPEALKHLVGQSRGVKIRGISTVECDACGMAKVKRQVRRQRRVLPEKAGIRLAIDFHDMSGDPDYTSAMLVTDRYSGYIWDYYLPDQTAPTLIGALEHLLRTLERQLQCRPEVIECDNEIPDSHQVSDFLSIKNGIRLEPSAPYAQSQNGGAERSGGVIKEKARAMRIGAKLPSFLWVEIWRAAVYLYNRTPKYIYNWKTPYKRFYTYFAFRDGVVVTERKPDQTHLRVYGCKAFAMTTDALKKKNRRQRLNPRGWIGYLVGYNSTNIYRVWNPLTNKVISTRDVIFNEKETFSGDVQHLKDDLKELNEEELIQHLTDAEVPQGSSINLDASTQEEDEELSALPEGLAFEQEAASYPHRGFERDPTITQGETGRTLVVGDRNREEPDGTDHPYTTARFTPYLTPETCPLRPAALLVATIREPPVRKEGENPPRLQAAKMVHVPPSAGTSPGRDGANGAPRVISTPSSYWEAAFNAGRLASVKGTWNGKVFTKCKARLVVRGDQQAKSTHEDTYASTLAGRSFRTLMAIAARFDLELLQYDVVNAFVNAELKQDVYMRMPGGYRKPGLILKLQKALYGLRQSPLLWQKELTTTLTNIGFKSVPHEPCCLSKGGILIFFYVDDLIVAYEKTNQKSVEWTIGKLREKYQLSGGDMLQWFLGIEIIRNRNQRLIWLSQSSFVDKITSHFRIQGGKPSLTPMTTKELLPNEERASTASIQQYQRKTGSVLYLAVITRPDIAFAVSRLCRFNMNPSDDHHEALDHLFRYLQNTRALALQLGGTDTFDVYSDASFADNTIDRKSSQAYVMKLFGGTIGWRANKQDTVTTSTTEAELLALAQAAKESMFISRLITELGVTLDNRSIIIQCDNAQTIRLINSDVALLQTKLRHVDIHNHWLRQEALANRISVRHTPTTEMIADGLTKALPAQQFQKFVTQVGLVDIKDKIEERRTKELTAEDFVRTEEHLDGGRAE